MKKERITYLLNVYTSGKATVAEKGELLDWVMEAEDDEALKRFMLDVWNQQHSKDEYSYVDWEEIYSQIVSRASEGKQKKSSRIRRLSWIAAASILLIVSVVYFYPSSNEPEKVVAVQPLKKDVAPPTGDKAVLILADGSKIEMDSASNGTIALQGNVKVVRLDDGTVSYVGRAGGAVSYNTFNVPKGSKPLSLMLADGSKVWLNVGSSITFPTAFVGKEREVTMVGEAYFEVAHNAAMPFKVRGGDLTVNVLGTHFNVNAYKDDGVEKVTLLEGSVVVNRKNQIKTLKPGQQALVRESGEDIRIQKDVDLSEVMAWRDGKFVFNQRMDIKGIMRQLERWYNVDIVYQGEVSQRFWGSISKDVNLSQVLKILEATGGVRFEIVGNKVTVLPAAP